MQSLLLAATGNNLHFPVTQIREIHGVYFDVTTTDQMLRDLQQPIPAYAVNQHSCHGLLG